MKINQKVLKKKKTLRKRKMDKIQIAHLIQVMKFQIQLTQAIMRAQKFQILLQVQEILKALRVQQFQVILVVQRALEARQSQVILVL